MATRRIDTTIALDGEQAFKQGLASAAREMRVLESESRALAAAFGNSGDAAAAAAAKQKNLQNQVSQQEQIVSALERAVKDAANAYGDSSAEVDGYAIKLNNARTRLANLQKALSNADREVEELGRDSQKAGQQISKGIGEGAQEAERDLRSMMDTMQDSLNSIQSNTAVVAIKTAWDMAKGAYSSIEGFVSGTVDYRRQLSFLQLNAEESGFDFESIKRELIEVTALTGDTSSAIEGLSNLLAVPAMDANTMERAIEALGGAVVRFPDTVKFESLADSLQETLASGEATGQFSELLSRMSVDVEDFNAALEKSPTAAGDLEVALAYMAAGGLNDVYQKWQDTNREMQDAREQEAELGDALAGLAGEVEFIVTGAQSLITNLVNGTTEAIRNAKEGLHQWAADEGWVDDKSGATGAVDPWLWGTKTEYTESPYEIVNGKLVYRGIKQQELPKEVHDFREANAGWVQYNDTAKEDGKEAGAAYAEGFAEGFDVTLDLTGVEAKQADAWTNTSIQSSVDDALSDISFEEYFKKMEQAGEDGGEQLTEGFDAGVAGGDASAANAGAAFGAAYARGIMSQVSYVSSAAASLAAAAAARAGAAYAGAASQGMISGVLNIDGRPAGTFLAPYVSEAMAVNVE